MRGAREALGCAHVEQRQVGSELGGGLGLHKQ
jgi:hypothetical protein